MMIPVVVESYHPLTRKEDERQQVLLRHQHSLHPTLVQLRHFGTLFPRRFFLEVPCKGRECFEQKEVCRCKSGSRVVAETEVEVDGSDEVTNKSQNSRWWCGSWVWLFG
jgi:hypothetical protein